MRASSSGRVAKHAYCDKGFRGHGYEGQTEIHIAGSGKRKKSRWERFWRRRRSAIEPALGHLKGDNRMGRNYLKGAEGDRVNAILAACGYNLRKLLRATFLPLFKWLRTVLPARSRRLARLTSPNKRLSTVPIAA